MAQRSHRLYPEADGSLHYDIIERGPQRRLRICIIRRKEKKLATAAHHRVAENRPTSSGVTVFLMHGVAGSIEVWRSQFDLVQAPAVDKIVAVDLIGHGESSAPHHHEAYQFEAIAADITEVFTQFRSMSNVLIGHSYGYILFCCYIFILFSIHSFIIC